MPKILKKFYTFFHSGKVTLRAMITTQSLRWNQKYLVIIILMQLF